MRRLHDVFTVVAAVAAQALLTIAFVEIAFVKVIEMCGADFFQSGAEVVQNESITETFKNQSELQVC